ncbi:MAG: hypothetical protein RIC35_21765 [Marinoscillum sp.]
MKKALWVLLVMIMVGILPFACDFGSRTNYASSFTIDSLSLFSGQIINATSNPYVEPVDFETKTDTLSHSMLGFEIKIANVSYTHTDYGNNSSLFNSAFADPEPPKSEETITLISIYSDQPLSTSTMNFEAGDNLVNIFEGHRGYEWATIHKMLENFDHWYDYESIVLRFSEYPTHILSQHFTIKITMSDGRIFELLSDKIITK